MALTLLSANNASTVLSAGISASATTLTVNTGTGGLFPSPVSGTSFFKLTLIDAATGTLTEIVHVTARTGDTMTIVRGQEGTTNRLWSANDIAANMMTAGTLDLFAQSGTLGGAALLNVGTTAGTVAAGNDGRITGALQKSANLSDLANVQTALTNLGLGDAAKLGVATIPQMAAGTSTSLLPTVAAVMSLFSKRSFTAADYIRIPDVPGGLIIQFGYVGPYLVNTQSSTLATITLPIPFPTSFLCGVTGVNGGLPGSLSSTIDKPTGTAPFSSFVQRFANTRTDQSVYSYWLTIGY
ncbi:TPA: hypothetical protein PXQ99_001477 [Yersinia enterocolitica]|nr:hypothetical protein [Yersinia enterocolitica]